MQYAVVFKCLIMKASALSFLELLIYISGDTSFDLFLSFINWHVLFCVRPSLVALDAIDYFFYAVL